MKSVVLTGLRRMEVRPAPDAVRTDETGVRVSVERVGVCGSDVHYYATGRIGSQVVRYPFRVGHEFAGIVLETGSSVTRVRPGDRVAVDPAMWCGTCDQCRAGRRHTCRRLRFLGCPGQAEGCLCETVVMPQTSCFPVNGMDAETAALLEPLSIGVYAVRCAGAMAGGAIAILGAGPIGLSVLMAARAAGCAAAWVSDPREYRREVARQAGADGVVDAGENTVDRVLQVFPGGVDAVFECCGEHAALDQSIRLLRPGGQLLVIGIPREERISLHIDEMRRREITVRNVRRQNECVEAAIDLVRSGRVRPGFMVTHRFPLERTAEAFELVDGYRDGVIKAMIEVR